MPATKLKPKQKPKVSARQRVYAHLQQGIISGKIARGTVLSELQISQDLRVSRTPVREAIGQLVAEGIVEQSPNRSSIVVDLSRTDIVDLYEVREALETFAVRKAAERGMPAPSVEHLKKILQQLEEIHHTLATSGKQRLDDQEQAAFMMLDLRLHALLVLSTQNARMQKIVNDTRILVRIFSIRRQGHDLKALEIIHKQHCEIVDAVLAQDADRAAGLLAAHIRHSLQERLEEYDAYTRERLMQKHSAAFDLGIDPATVARTGM
ncbi:GntR family transcriptional regulator [Terriglobus aquaticus]|uniref:GntR family transcriptional regulator n=1 Tax=Terriglobus aquaticus TaxID=940139 RepID=A0ABW9KM56_9BACT|nr:GntR family transcriptional regulator [Terriglobus aquaticus]